MISDFETFLATQAQQSETFAFWLKFTQMVSLFGQRRMRLSATIHRQNLKTFLSIRSMKKTAEIKMKDKKELVEGQKVLNIACVRGYDIKRLFQYDLVSTTYLFDKDGLMTKPVKSDLCKTLEAKLTLQDWVAKDQWTQEITAYLVDVMAQVRRVPITNLKTFGDMSDSYLAMVKGLCSQASRIYFVFDTYIDGSVKDSERIRRCDTTPIDIIAVH